jgi:WhiB family transcriptional regulator, redox-sensing transcriptional regulator
VGAHHRPTIRAIAGPWVEEAGCRGVPTRWFFPATDTAEEQALAVCDGCVVRDACLRFAIEHEQWHGIWGGTSERSRRPMIRSYRQGAVA